jgi:phenylalanyl-tRNA synthetase alpha chain
MDIDQIQKQFQSQLDAIWDSASLDELRNQYLGRKRGLITSLLKEIPGLPIDQRTITGKKINDFKKLVEEALNSKASQLQRSAAFAETDWTLPGTRLWIGAIHPLTLIRHKIEDIFREMGYAVAEGPELETDFYNFTALNFPPDHPARDTQDTFFVDRKEPNGVNLLLRTHTSPVQIRTMLEHKPPVRILCPGRVYRRDEVDATHSPIFHQMEGLVVDEHITFADLKGTLLYFFESLFQKKVKVSFRPTFFPFTEPSADVSVSCVFCDQKGCGVCKYSGWIEILGSGMVHPNVLQAVGIDSERYTGFAFGMGIERLAITLFGIPDIRLFFQNDIRFLSQFRVVS